MKCKICSRAISDGWKRCPECREVFQRCPLCSRVLLPEDYEALPKVILLDEVRADVKELLYMLDNSATVMFPKCSYDERYKLLKKKISEHFSNEKENI